VSLHLSVPAAWQPIAQRRRAAKDGKWTELPGAPITLFEAQLRAEGSLVQALRYTADRTVVVRPQEPDSSAEA
jgi:hypothetical protein